LSYTENRVIVGVQISPGINDVIDRRTFGDVSRPNPVKDASVPMPSVPVWKTTHSPACSSQRCRVKSLMRGSVPESVYSSRTISSNPRRSPKSTSTVIGNAASSAAAQRVAESPSTSLSAESSPPLCGWVELAAAVFPSARSMR
jgi:hypothetical protein